MSSSLAPLDEEADEDAEAEGEEEEEEDEEGDEAEPSDAPPFFPPSFCASDAVSGAEAGEVLGVSAAKAGEENRTAGAIAAVATAAETRLSFNADTPSFPVDNPMSVCRSWVRKLRNPG
ncbi:hypothetical protein SSP35_01_01790 [Streptomyces sp. NBRC 110611]|nr:hypothetical protein SSP35_01_01790 [Streptomyces sp. NBRC 110611]